MHSVAEKPGREDVPDPGKQCSEHQPWEHVGSPTSREMPRLWPACQQPGTTVEGDVGADTLSSTGMDSRRGRIWTPEVQAASAGGRCDWVKSVHAATWMNSDAQAKETASRWWQETLMNI